MNTILCIGATHGDEPIGVCALQILEKRVDNFDWIIGNEKAYEQNTRCFEGDLNRSAPGIFGAPNYASRRAAEIIALAQNYKYTIDLHGTTAGTGIFTIISRATDKNITLAMQLGIKNIIIWPAINASLKGPLSEYTPCGLEIECGPKDSLEIQNELIDILERFIKLQMQPEINMPVAKPNCFSFYEVYSELRKPEIAPQLSEFCEITTDNETFFPLLIGRYQDITCYKMKRVEYVSIKIQRD